MTNYAEVANRSMSIKYVVENELMPPWPPDPNYTHLVGERILSAAEKQTIIDWVNSGAPQGDPSLEPALPNFPSGSVLGVPDMVLSMSRRTPQMGTIRMITGCSFFPQDSVRTGRSQLWSSARETRRSFTMHCSPQISMGRPSKEMPTNQAMGTPPLANSACPPNIFTGLGTGYLPDRFPAGTGQILPAGSDRAVALCALSICRTRQLLCQHILYRSADRAGSGKL